MSYPRHLTDAERSALPIGPFVEKCRPVTNEDRARGIRGRIIVTAERPRVRIEAVSPDEPIAWRDEQGRAWTFGQWENGNWFKQPAPIFDA